MVAQDAEEFNVKPETAGETETRLAQILDGMGRRRRHKRSVRLALVFELRFDGQLWPDEYRFDPNRGRWMEWKGGKWAGHWQPAADDHGQRGRAD